MDMAQLLFLLERGVLASPCPHLQPSNASTLLATPIARTSISSSNPPPVPIFPPGCSAPSLLYILLCLPVRPPQHPWCPASASLVIVGWWSSKLRPTTGSFDAMHWTRSLLSKGMVFNSLLDGLEAYDQTLGKRAWLSYWDQHWFLDRDGNL